MMTLRDPAAKVERAIDAYLQEVKAMTGLSFQDKPMRKANPYAIIDELEVILTDMKKAVAAHEASTFKRLEHEATVVLTRANVESIDLETWDLIEPTKILP